MTSLLHLNHFIREKSNKKAKSIAIKDIKNEVKRNDFMLNKEQELLEFLQNKLFI